MTTTNPIYGSFTTVLPVRTDTFNFANEFNYSMKVNELYETELKIRSLLEHVKTLEHSIHSIKSSLPKQITELYEQYLTYEALKS